ncbi:MAG: YceI family protein [Pseudomonadota bacterium]
MRLLTSTSLSLAVLALASCGQTGSDPAIQLSDISGDWSLDASSSKIAFASIKVGELIETHYFPGLSGSMSESGETVIDIPLDQVETKIDQRNERMRSMFFQTDTYPTAQIRASVDPTAFANLQIGGRIEAELDAVLSLHGAESTVFANVFVTRIAPSRVEVATSEPVIVHVADHNLEAGLEALRDIAGLTDITPAVPVTFTFVFEAVNTG